MAANNSKGQNKGTKKDLSVETLKVAVLAGETYPVKDQLKSAGGSWLPAVGGWAFESAEKAAGAIPKSANGISVDEVDVATVKGDTFPVRKLLGALGGSWEPGLSRWVFENDERARKAIAVVKLSQ